MKVIQELSDKLISTTGRNATKVINRNAELMIEKLLSSSNPFLIPLDMARSTANLFIVNPFFTFYTFSKKLLN